MSIHIWLTITRFMMSPTHLYADPRNLAGISAEEMNCILRFS